MSKISILAVAFILAILPMAAMAGSISVTSSVTDGNVFASHDLISTQYGELETVMGAHNDVMGRGDVAYSSTLTSDGTNAYKVSVTNGHVMGSQSSSYTQVTLPKVVAQANCVGNSTDTEPVTNVVETPCNSAPSVYTTAHVGSTYDLTSGYASAVSSIPTLTYEVVGAGNGSIGMFGNWLGMDGPVGCPFINSNSGTSSFLTSGTGIAFHGVFLG